MAIHDYHAGACGGHAHGPEYSRHVTTALPRPTSSAQRQSNAVARAESLTVDYYLDGDTMIVASATTPGTLYIVSATGCTCDAGLRELPGTHAAYRLDTRHPR